MIDEQKEPKPESNPSERAASSVVRAIEKDIQSDVLHDGEMLPSERDMMERFSVSRTVIREATHILSSRGLVESRPRFRPTVKKPNFDTAMGALEGIVHHLLNESGGVKNLFDTRIFIEVGLVRSAAENATRDDLQALKAALDVNEAAIFEIDKFYETDMAFHRVFYTISKNPIAEAIHKAYMTWLGPRWKMMPRSAERNQFNFESHKAIFQAILMRDPDLAEAALRFHMKDAWAQIPKSISEN